MLKKTPTLWGF